MLLAGTRISHAKDPFSRFQLLTIFGDYITASTIISVALLGISVGGLIGFFAASHAPMRTMVGASLLLPFTIFGSLGVAASQWPKTCCNDDAGRGIRTGHQLT